MKTFIFFCVIASALAVRVPFKNTCTEKPDGGRCLAYIPMYFYDPETGSCKEFIYGGCEGNGNRYGTEKDCLENCAGVKQQTSDVCSLEKDSGPCYGYFPKYYYDQESGTCKKFIYGGCRGNGNNFKTREECQATCTEVKQAALDSSDCDLEPETGLCRAYIPRYYYDKVDGQCKKFVYGGCGGNRNNFGSAKECYSKCGVLDSYDCDKAAETGMCKAYIPRYYYDKADGQCKKFVYGGCGGNRNNFGSEEECYNRCEA